MSVISNAFVITHARGFQTVLQQAIYNALNAYVPLDAPVYDDVPEGATFPYVVIGDDFLTDFSTDTWLGRRALIRVHTWSEYRGRKEIKELQDDVEAALERANLTAFGYNFITIDAESSESFLDSDGLRRHGVQTFAVLIEKLED